MLIALAVFVAILLFTIPASPWEFDEILFMRGLRHYDPIHHQPPPPGYPLFINFGHLLRPLFPSDLSEMVALNLTASVVGLLFLALAFRNLTGDARAGLAGALLFYLSPVMLVHATTGMSDPGALCLLSVALYFGSSTSRRGPALFGAFAALAVGWRPQFAIVVLPLLAVTVGMMRRWRERAVAVAVFTVVCVAWLIPLVTAVGGIDRLLQFEGSQAQVVAAHDADLSRNGWSAAAIASRFIAHPWGTKLSSLPVIAAAAAGIALAIRRREKRVIPIAVATGLYLAFALRVMDPADGTRYSLPATLGVAFFAGIGAAALTVRLRLPAYTVVALFGAGSLIYVSPIIAQRTSSDAPPLQAAKYALAAFPANAVALYDLPLWPHAGYFLGDRRPTRVEDGMKEYFDRPDVPLFIYAEGASSMPGARIFRWEPSDAYSKITRNLYRVVSVVPLPPERRFRVIHGIWGAAREAEGGDEWRWMAPDASLQLPHGPARLLKLRVGLPVIYPTETNSLTITTGTERRTVTLRRGSRVDLTLPVAEGAPVVTFAAAQSFVPAEIPGSLNRDPRRLAVNLYDLQTSPAGGPAF